MVEVTWLLRCSWGSDHGPVWRALLDVWAFIRGQVSSSRSPYNLMSKLGHLSKWYEIINESWSGRKEWYSLGQTGMDGLCLNIHELLQRPKGPSPMHWLKYMSVSKDSPSKHLSSHVFVLTQLQFYWFIKRTHKAFIFHTSCMETNAPSNLGSRGS